MNAGPIKPLPGRGAEPVEPTFPESWSEADQRLVVLVRYVGVPGDDETAREGVSHALRGALEYVASGRAGSSIPEHVGNLVHVRLDVLICEDVLGPRTLAVLEEFAQFCVSRSMELTVQPVVREVMVGSGGR